MRLRELMRRGLAVHHAGLLPIAKEMVEMLFCQGYIKVARAAPPGLPQYNINLSRRPHFPLPSRMSTCN